MTPKRTRTIGVVLATLSFALLIPSVYAVAKRLEGRQVPMVWFLDPILSNDFAFKGEPVHVEETTVTNAQGDEQPAVIVTYRGHDTLVPIEGVDARLPTLLKFEDRMEILPMVEGGLARSAEEVNAKIESGEASPRLIIATRRTNEEYDPGSWGLVRRKDWRYTFYELLPDAPAEDSVRVTEDTYRNLEELVDPDIRAEKGREGDLWMYHAMMQVTPANYYPKNKQVDESIHAMGWAWPAAGVSVLGVVLGTLMVLMSTVTPPEID